MAFIYGYFKNGFRYMTVDLMVMSRFHLVPISFSVPLLDCSENWLQSIERAELNFGC